MFRSRTVWKTSFVLFAVVFAAGAYVLHIQIGSEPGNTSETAHLDKELYKPSKADRSAYIFNMLKNPATHAIPHAIRNRELAHADQISHNKGLATRKKKTFNWFEAGPFDVGGRTRALAIDRQNNNRLVAGGVSGGLWESVDRGATWRAIEPAAENLSVTYIEQDPRPGESNIWYYASGEFVGNSASDPARDAPYFGGGLYKSTDGGNTWYILPAGHAGDEITFDSPFDFVNRIAINPVTGSLFIAANAAGIYRSGNEGESFGTVPAGHQFPGPVLGGINDHYWSDIAINDEGVALAALSSTGSNSQTDYSPGIYRSTDDGLNWTDITPNSFPRNHGRSIVAFAPSNQEVAYIFTTTLNTVNDQEDVKLYRFNVASGNATDLSNNLTQLSEAGNIDTQGGYNMALAVKPDDQNFVLLGATNIYRSRNGFSSGLVDRLDYWIGGYDAVDDDFGNYENHHPDQHLFIFDPEDPNRVWNANDGGVYMTSNISRQNEVLWFDMNQGYNTTQFYTVALGMQADDPRIAGGAQDNGTPFMRLNDLSNSSRNISVGDGAHLYFGESYAFVGFQNGALLRLQYNDDETPTFAGFSFVQPSAATGQLFISPFAIDPADENIMYYAAGSSLWRNKELDAIRSGQTDNGGVDDGWERLSEIPLMAARNITAMAISEDPDQPHVLYYGASDTRTSNPQAPLIYRLTNAHTGNGDDVVTLQIPGAPNGSYLSGIAVNPENTDELLVTLSNYEIIGLFHSMDGGQRFTAVEGNLEGTDALPGPSLRAATFLNAGNVPMYFVGTSTGLYSTSNLDGSSTVWEPEGEDELGRAVVWDVVSRPSDEVVAVATHGRGLYVGSQDPNFNPTPIPEAYTLSQNYPNPFASITRIPYNLPERSLVSLAVYDLSGRKVIDLVLNEEQETGRHEVVFNASSVASGVYLFQLLTNPLSGSQGASFSKTRKMMVIK